ncbi:hypothetical protein FOA52_006896 [Chlamydomonas sp. UWO 241]|nr:hypothetical protein FOA52_006896 [Chlamydomonas sp. UWO 241]
MMWSADVVPTFSSASVEALRHDVSGSSWAVEFKRDLQLSMFRAVQAGISGFANATVWTARNILRPAVRPLEACYYGDAPGQGDGDRSDSGSVAGADAGGVDLMYRPPAQQQLVDTGSGGGALGLHSRKPSGLSNDWRGPATHLGAGLTAAQLRRRLWPWEGDDAVGGGAAAASTSAQRGFGYDAAASVLFAGWMPDGDDSGRAPGGGSGGGGGGGGGGSAAGGDGGGGGGAGSSGGSSSGAGWWADWWVPAPDARPPGSVSSWGRPSAAVPSSGPQHPPLATASAPGVGAEGGVGTDAGAGASADARGADELAPLLAPAPPPQPGTGSASWMLSGMFNTCARGQAAAAAGSRAGHGGAAAAGPTGGPAVVADGMQRPDSVPLTSSGGSGVGGRAHGGGGGGGAYGGELGARGAAGGGCSDDETEGDEDDDLDDEEDDLDGGCSLAGGDDHTSDLVGGPVEGAGGRRDSGGLPCVGAQADHEEAGEQVQMHHGIRFVVAAAAMAEEATEDEAGDAATAAAAAAGATAAGAGAGGAAAARLGERSVGVPSTSIAAVTEDTGSPGLHMASPPSASHARHYATVRQRSSSGAPPSLHDGERPSNSGGDGDGDAVAASTIPPPPGAATSSVPTHPPAPRGPAPKRHLYPAGRVLHLFPHASVVHLVGALSHTAVAADRAAYETVPPLAHD